jgi:hypothetical protein
MAKKNEQLAIQGTFYRAKPAGRNVYTLERVTTDADGRVVAVHEEGPANYMPIIMDKIQRAIITQELE